MQFFRHTSKARKPKSVVVGLDGVPYTLIQNLRKAGRIRHMNNLFNKGYFGQMSVCIPEISSVSWSSFMTGTQAAEHGIFGFIDLKPYSYSMYFPNYQHVQVPALWDNLGKKGKRSVVINVPATYPAKNINGVLISGFVAIDINKAVTPPSTIPRLNDMGYRIDVDTLKGRKDSDFLFHDLNVTLQGRKAAVDYFWDEVDWDFLMVVITGTDRLMHFLWQAYEEENHPYHNDFINYFENVDAFVGHVFNRFESLPNSSDNVFYMLSDHGFTKLETEVYLNRWLENEGYLKFKTQEPTSVMDIGPGSTAFALDPSRVYLNLQEKFPLGTLAAGDYDRVRNEIKSGLESMTLQDEPIVKRVYFKEELFSGPLMDQAPDLVVLSRHGYDLKGRIGSHEVFGPSELQGMHTQDDAFFHSSSNIPCKNIFEAKSIIEASL